MGRSVAEVLAARFAPGHEDPANVSARARLGIIEGWVSVAVNALLAALKFWLGAVTGSIALAADAAHTLSDSITSGVVIYGFMAASAPADRRHPFGHARAESIAAVAIAVLLGVVAFEFGHEAVQRIMSPAPVSVEPWVAAVVFAALLAKLWLGMFAADLGRIISSSAVMADAWHHLSDVFATGLVLAAFAGSALGVAWLDGAMGVAVAVVIAWAALVSMKAAVGPLLSETAPEEMFREVARVARAHEGVLGVHDILIHRYGTADLISLHVEVPATETPVRLHTLADRIETEISARFPGHALVHVDPVDRGHPMYDEVRRAVAGAVAAEPACQSYHDLRVYGEGGRLRVAFDISTETGRSEGELVEARRRIRDALAAGFPGATFVISLEPSYLHDAP